MKVLHFNHRLQMLTNHHSMRKLNSIGDGVNPVELYVETNAFTTIISGNSLSLQRTVYLRHAVD
jgi:hypothetical protein